MKTEVVLAALLAGASLLSSCSRDTDRPQKGQLPSVNEALSLRVTNGGQYEFGDETLNVYEVCPLGNPSGYFSLKKIQNGQANVLQELKVKAMLAKGSVAVRLTNKGVGIGFDIKNTQSELLGGQDVLFPAEAKYASAGTSECMALQRGREQIIWHRIFFVGQVQSTWSYVADDFAGLLERSKEYPSMLAYVVTVKMEETPSQPSDRTR